jgi:hypothetical protein
MPQDNSNTTSKVPTLSEPDLSLGAKWLEEQTPRFRKLHWTREQRLERIASQRRLRDPSTTYAVTPSTRRLCDGRLVTW